MHMGGRNKSLSFAQFKEQNIAERDNNPNQRQFPMTKPLNIGMIGYGFMGRTHSNAYSQVNHLFDVHNKPVLKAVCARDEAKVKEFAQKWGYESYETDWK